MAKTVRKGRIGLGDIQMTPGSFTRSTSVGGTQTLSPFPVIVVDANGQYATIQAALDVSGAKVVVVPDTYAGAEETSIAAGQVVLDLRNGTPQFRTIGVFTNTQINPVVRSLLNSIDILSEVIAGQGSDRATDAIQGGVAVPSSSTVGLANAVAGYANNSSTTTHALGGYFQGRALANSAKVFGSNSLVVDTSGLTTGVEMNANEADVVPINAASAYDSLVGYLSVIAGPQSGAFSVATAFLAKTNTSATWQTAFRSNEGAAVTGLYVGKLASAGVSGSQSILFNSNNGGADIPSAIQADSAGALQFTTNSALLNMASGKISKYGGITTVSNGAPAEYAQVNLTAQGAAIGATTLYAVPAAGAGQYRVCFNMKLTQAATTSSVLGGTNGFQLVYTDQDDSVVVTTVAGLTFNSTVVNLALNTTQAQMNGCLFINAKASTNIQYQVDYTSVGATPMQFNLHIRLEAM